jgi:hypothetical protein
MRATIQPRLDALPPAQRKMWPDLRGVGSLGYVLYGGTALALRLAHRKSVDFDFFTDQALNRRALLSALPSLKRSTLLQDSPDTITAVVPVGRSKVKVSFFADLHIGRVGKPDWTDDGVLQIASLEDLLATKLKVLLQRVEAKDYQDVVSMLEHGGSLADGLAAARTLYGGAFQPTECLKALIYFHGGDLQSLPRVARARLTAAVSEVRELPKARRRSRSLSAATAARRPRG